MKGLYAAAAFAGALALTGCSYNAYKAGDISKRAEGNYSVVCTPVADLVTDEGFACRDEKGANVFVIPDRNAMKKALFWKQSPYKSAQSLLVTHGARNESIEITGTFNMKDNKLEAILLDFGEEGKVFLNQ